MDTRRKLRKQAGPPKWPWPFGGELRTSKPEVACPTPAGGKKHIDRARLYFECVFCMMF